MKRYDSYKDLGVEWIGEIPSHWGRKRLKHISESVNGYSFKSNDFDREYDVPVIRIGDVGESIDFTNCVKVKSHFLEDKSEFLVKKNDILIGLTGGTIGKSGRYNYDSPSLLNQRVGLLRNKESVLNGLLHHYVNSEVFIRYIFFDCYGGGQDNISMNDILNMVFPYPPLSEQQQIVSFLDTKTSLIDSLIEKTQRKIELLKEKRTSLINEVVTKGLNPNVEMKDSGVEWIGEIPSHWRKSCVRYITKEHRQGYYSSDSYTEKGLRVVRITDLNDDRTISIEKSPYYELSEVETERFLLKNGDFLFPRTGGVGRFGIFNDTTPSIYGSFLIRFRFSDKVVNQYMRFYFDSGIYLNQILSEIHGGVNQNVHVENIKDSKIFYPDETEQQQIVEYLDEQTQLIDNTISIEEKRIELLKEYRQSLISEVVTGKLKVVE